MNKENDAAGILVIQTAFLGDIVLTLPLLRLLKKHKPGARILLLTTPVGESLLRDQQVADRIIVYDKNGKEKGVQSMVRKIREIREYSIGTIICPHRSVRSGIISLFSGASKRIGYKLPYLLPFYNIRIKRDKKLHEVDRILALLAPLGIKSGGADRYPVLSTRNTVRDKNTVGIAPGSVWGTKQWTESGYAVLIKKLHELGFSVVLIGNKHDIKTVERIKSMAGGEVKDTVGKTDLPGLADLLSGICLLVSNDNGAMQVAQAVNTPVVAIFGPTIPEQGFAPIRPNTIVIESKGLYCRPCSAHGPRECPEGHFLCMESITPDTVFRAVKDLLNKI